MMSGLGSSSLSFKLPPYSIVAIQALPSGFCLRTSVTNMIMNLRWIGKGVWKHLRSTIIEYSILRLMISNLSLNHPLTWKNIILPSQQQLTSSSLACPFWIGKRGVFSFIPARHSIKVSDSNRFLSLFLLEPRLMINVGMPGRLEKRHHHTIFWWWFQCYQLSWFEICHMEIISRMVYFVPWNSYLYR